MSFCRFSPSFTQNSKTVVDNAFINDYLPYAPNKCGEVYLLGLMLCGNADSANNTAEFIAKKLEITADDVVSIFKYWEDKGLVTVLSTDPVEVRFLPVKNASTVKLYDTHKFADFNLQLQALFDKTMLMQSDYQEYYYLIEQKHMEQNALIEIVRFSIEYKGFKPNKAYAITLARDWEKQGIHTLAQVKEKIEEFGLIDDNVTTILKATGTTRPARLEDKELVSKWMNQFGFELNVIIYVANMFKEKKRILDLEFLDRMLQKYFEFKAMSIEEITLYEKQKETYRSIAIAVNKELGIYYDDITKEIDAYVVGWLNMGYDQEMLAMVADNCFKSSIRTLDGFNSIINKLFRLGIVTMEAYQQYLMSSLKEDEKIKEVLSALNLSRNVNSMDRTFYRTWSVDWGFEHEVILYGASLAVGKTNAMQYLNKVLSNWNGANTKTLEKAKKNSVQVKEAPQNNFIHNNYSKEQIASFLTNLDDIEV